MITFIISYTEYFSGIDMRLCDSVEVQAETLEEAYEKAKEATKDKEGVVLGSAFIKGKPQNESIFDQLAEMGRQYNRNFVERT